MNSSIHERLKHIRTTLELTQEEFAAMLALSKPAISSYERGTRTIPKRLIKAVCHEFNVSSEYLVHGTGPMFKNRDENAINEVAAMYTLNSQDIAVLKSYLGLAPSERAAINTFLLNIGKNIKNDL